MRDWSPDRVAEAAGARLVAPAPQPRRISPMIASGSSLRGLSEVTITTSACSHATAPMSGRLARSRSPPAPNTTIRRLAASGRAVSRTFSSESGVWA